MPRFTLQEHIISAVLILKLGLVPLLIAAVTLAGRYWGPAVAGWLSAFPIVAAPILFFLALEHGASFAASAAAGTLSAILAVLAFALSYAWAATRFTWPSCLVIGFAAYALAVMCLILCMPSLVVATPMVVVALAAAKWAFPVPADDLITAGTPANDIVLRMLAGAILVWLVTHFSARIGSRLSGVFAMFPVMSSVLVVFSHRHSGASFAIQLLRGMVFGYYAFGTFCLVLTQALQAMNVSSAFAVALLAATLVQGVSRVYVLRG